MAASIAAVSGFLQGALPRGKGDNVFPLRTMAVGGKTFRCR
jgi:hypothetical protein